MISLISPSEVNAPTSIAIGSFDGLHQGHRTLIKSVVTQKDHVPTIASFWPHPREVLYGEKRLRLDLPEEKLPILEKLGIEQLVLIPFDLDLSKISAEDFVQNILLKKLQAKNISVGENFRFGYKRSGDINTIKESTKNLNINLNIVPILSDIDGRISSSRVRALLSKSDLENAQKLLNRPYSFSGKVVRGKNLGKKLGCPTANLQIDERKFLPGEGVYACWTTIENNKHKFPSVMNLGTQPTINSLLISSVEVHIINKEIDLYDLNLTVQPVKKIRPQIKFSDLGELSEQIKKDKQNALKILNDIS